MQVALLSVEGLQQHVFVEREKERVIRIELVTHRPFKQFHVAVSKLPERGGDSLASVQRIQCARHGISYKRRGSGSGDSGLEKVSAGMMYHVPAPGVLEGNATCQLVAALGVVQRATDKSSLGRNRLYCIPSAR